MDEQTQAEDETRERPENPAAAAAREVPRYVAELKAYFSHYLSAKADGIKLSIKRFLGFLILGIVLLIVAAGLILVSMFLLLSGLAHLLAVAFGGRLWLGEMIVGVVFLGAIIGATILFLKRMVAASRRQAEKKYDGKHTQQRVDFGHDVHQRADDKDTNRV